MYLEYIEFASGWRPPTYRDIPITRIRPLRLSISKNGHPYVVYLGEITDEDATCLRIRDPNVKFRNS